MSKITWGKSQQLKTLIVGGHDFSKANNKKQLNNVDARDTDHIPNAGRSSWRRNGIYQKRTQPP